MPWHFVVFFQLCWIPSQPAKALFFKKGQDVSDSPSLLLLYPLSMLSSHVAISMVCKFLAHYAYELQTPPSYPSFSYKGVYLCVCFSICEFVCVIYTSFPIHRTRRYSCISTWQSCKGTSTGYLHPHWLGYCTLYFLQKKK